MANSMELVLTTPVEKLIPALIGWNNTELLAEVNANLEKYRGKVYDDSSIAEAKADRAGLKKFEDALNSERIRIKKVYEAPLDRFTAEVNEVISAVKAISSEIDVQVKTFEAEQRSQKRTACEEYFGSIIGDLSKFITYDKIAKDAWLNASVTLTKAKKEMDAIVEQIRNELTTIEALRSNDETTLKSFYFRTLKLSDAITQNELLKAEKQRIAAETARLQAVEQTAPEKPVETPVAAQTDTQEFSVSFRVTGTKEQLGALSKFMRDNGINFTKV